MRWLIGLGLVVAMLAFGVGVYHAAGMLRGDHNSVHKPTEVSAVPLPGTLYVVQSGAIYRFQHGNFAQVTREEGWMQPAVTADGKQLIAVKRQTNLSDLYLLSTGGKVVAQLTHNAGSQYPESNHWTFYPRLSPDGSTLFYAYDAKLAYATYQVDLAIFASPADPNAHGSVQWSEPNDYTGGDVDPVPLRSGGLIYTKYSIDDSFQVHAQVWYQPRAGVAGQALTPPELGCGQPALSPDEKLIAMVCTKGSNQAADLQVASFDANTLTLGSPATLVAGRLVASPIFSPDGKAIAYLAPSSPGGQFQLWTVGSSGPASVRDITTDLGLDSTSAPVWVGG
jgi:Tol biopolymer transport system component